jgi:opacity protein-like surface antigen
MKRRVALVVPLILLATSSIALARSDKPLRWHFDMGYSIVQGEASELVDNGWTVGGGALFKPNPKSPIGWRFDATYDWYDVETKELPEVRVDDGDADQWSLRGGIQWESGGDKVRFNAGAGVGWYWLHAELTETVLVPGWICDPYWYWYCFPGLVEGDVILADRSESEWGYYVSAGVTIPLSSTEFFIEAQYHWVEIDQKFETLPLVVGWRF